MSTSAHVPQARGGSHPSRGTPTRLRALGEIARTVAGVTGLEAVVRGGAEAARDALGATSVSVARWERQSGRVRVLVNAGQIAGDVEPFPSDETYSVRQLPTLSRLEDDPVGVAVDVDDRNADPEVVALLRARGQHSCLMVPIVVEGRAWGELTCARSGDTPRYAAADLPYARVVTALIAAGVSQAGHLERMSRLAYEDPLTGLANRRAVDERLERSLARHHAEGTVVTLLVCDVNGLKRVNDEQGHDAGDRLLTRVGRLLGEAAARLPGSLGARLGGDEFCLVADEHPAADVIRAAQDLCRRALDLGVAGLACGIASTADPVGPVTSATRLFRLADAAQYSAKRSGSTEPVIAGRGLPRDPAVALADRPPEGRDRRRLRGRLRVDPGAVLAALLAAGDETWVADVAGRLGTIGDSLVQQIDAAAWRLSRVEAGTSRAVTVSAALYRRAPVNGRWWDDSAAPGAERTLAGEVARVPRGGSVVVEAARPGNEAAAQRLLADSGFTAVVAAGATAADGSQWFLEIFADEVTAPVRALAPVVRAAVATAVLGTTAP